MKPIVNRVKSILFEPTKFFRKTKKEKGVKHAFKYLAIVGVVTAVLGTTVGRYSEQFFNAMLQSMFNVPVEPVPQITAGLIVGTYLALLLFSFLGAGLLHVWLLIFGGKKGYENNYQLYIYSRTPSLLLGWIPFAGLFTWIYDLVILVMGTKQFHGFSTKKAILIYAIPLAIIWLLSILALLAGIGFMLADPAVQA